MLKVTSLVVAGLALAMGALRPALAAPEQWDIDPVHSSIVFNITHNNGAGLVYGRFDKFSGTIMADPGDPESSSIEVHVDAASVDTAVEPRDKHLRTADFFNVEKFAEITFKSTGVQAVADASGEYLLSGELTMLGVTRPIQLRFRQHALTTDKKGRQITGFEANFVIKRSEWGMTNGIPGMSDDVNVMLAFECDKAMPETAAAAPAKAN
jgi:polyisoprenoid-binding protein YceI